MFNVRSEVQKKILNYFFLNEANKAYINELARIVEADPKNVYRILLRLEKGGVLTSEFKGKERYFYCNKKSPVYKGYKDIFLKTAGVETMLTDALKGIPNLKEAYIFGSYAEGKYGVESDIDLLLVGTHKTLHTQRVLHKIQSHIGREINVVNVTPEMLKKKLAGGDQFIKEVFAHKQIRIV
jgi:predicted nucleotidyltransferase